jgi:endonuclease/exonuclease/phosphatase family metal-dependent hydrolase
MPDLRLFTLNCWHGRANPTAIADLLSERSVDVACFQELGQRQISAVHEILPFGKLEPSAAGDGLGIALRHPSEVSPVPIPAREGKVVTLHPNAWPALAASVEIINVHLEAPHIRPWTALPRRRRQLEALTHWLSSHSPSHRVLVGDLNSTPLWPAYRRLTGLLEDGASAAGRNRGAAPERTWGPTARSPRLLRIDHVLTNQLTVLHCEVVRIEGSDHSGVLASLRLAD